MEENLNKTENKAQADFSNITLVQNLKKDGVISNMAADLKNFRQKLNNIGAKIVELKKKAQVVEQKPVAPQKKEEVKEVVAEQTKPASVSAAPKTQVKPTEQSQTQKRTFGERDNARFAGQNNGYQNRQGGFNRQPGQNGYNSQRPNGGFSQNRQGGRFTPTGERRFDNNTGDRKPGSYSGDSRFQNLVIDQQVVSKSHLVKELALDLLQECLDQLKVLMQALLLKITHVELCKRRNHTTKIVKRSHLTKSHF